MSIEQVKELLERMPKPAPNERGILSNINRDETLQALAELQAGGDAAVAAIVDLLVEPGKGNDHPARYALHGLALYVCGLGTRPRNDNERKAFAQSLAKALDGNRPAPVKEFVIRELQVCGGPEVIAAIGKCLSIEALSEAAAAALLAIGGPAAAAEFRRHSPAADARVRLIVVQNLGALRDQESIESLAKATTDGDAEVRTAACWALANIGDPAGIEACLAAAEKAEGYERIQSGKSRLLFAERLRDAGNQNEAERVLAHVRQTSTDESEVYLREIAERELASSG